MCNSWLVSEVHVRLSFSICPSKRKGACDCALWRYGVSSCWQPLTSFNLCSCIAYWLYILTKFAPLYFLIQPLRYVKHLAFVTLWSRGETVAAPRREAGRANPLGTVSVPNCSVCFQGCSDVDQCLYPKVLMFICPPDTNRSRKKKKKEKIRVVHELNCNTKHY